MVSLSSPSSSSEYGIGTSNVDGDEGAGLPGSDATRCVVEFDALRGVRMWEGNAGRGLVGMKGEKGERSEDNPCTEYQRKMNTLFGILRRAKHLWET